MGKFQVYKDAAGAYRWRLIASNGKIVADSAESYSSKQKCVEGIESVKQHAAAAATVEE